MKCLSAPEHGICKFWTIHGFGVKTNGGALIGFSYSEIRFLNKNIVKCLKIKAIYHQSGRVFIFSSFFFCFEALQITQSYNFLG